jgi:rRNA-processing protein FCF1
MNKKFYESVKYDKDTFDEFISKKFRKDVDGYIIVDPNIMYDSNTERIKLIEKLEEIRNATSDIIVREKYNPLIYMLSEGKRIGLKDSDIVLR